MSKDFPQGLVLEKSLNVSELQSTRRFFDMPSPGNEGEPLQGRVGEELAQYLSVYAAVLTKDPDRVCFGGREWKTLVNQVWGGYPGFPHSDPYAFALRKTEGREAPTGIVGRGVALAQMLEHFSILLRATQDLRMKSELEIRKEKLSRILDSGELYPSTPQDPVAETVREFSQFVGNIHLPIQAVFEYQKNVSAALASSSFLQAWRAYEDLLFVSRRGFHYLVVRKPEDLRQSNHLERLRLTT